MDDLDDDHHMSDLPCPCVGCNPPKCAHCESPIKRASGPWIVWVHVQPNPFCPGASPKEADRGARP